MAKLYLTDIDLNKNELQNAVFQNLASAPSTPKSGQYYFDTVSDTLMVFDGTEWKNALAPAITVATSDNLGGIKVGKTAAERVYPVQLDGDNKAYVEVPLATSSSAGAVKAGYSASGKNYAVALDTNGNMYVYVPWTDTIYSLPLATSSTRGGVQIGYSASGANVPVQLSSEKMYVAVTESAINSALSYSKITAQTTQKFYPLQFDANGRITGYGTGASIVNDLTSGGTTNILSAEQGRTLKGLIDGLPKAKSYASIQAMITALNGANNTLFVVGNNIFDVRLDTPDYWVTSVETTSVAYTYVNDATFISAITSGLVQVGYYKLSILETEKVDLTNYVTKTGAETLTNKTINADNNTITNLETDNFKSGVVVTSIPASPTNTTLPTAKAVDDLIDTKVSYIAKIQLATCGALATSGGVCTWTIANSYFDTSIPAVVELFETSTNQPVIADIVIDGSNNVTVTFNSSTGISAGAYKAIIIGYPNSSNR